MTPEEINAIAGVIWALAAGIGFVALCMAITQ